MMMLMFFNQMPELIPADRPVRWMNLRVGPGENLFGPDAVNGILHELPVLHHPLHIVGYPGLFPGARLHPHVPKQLLPRKSLDIVLADLDSVVTDDPVYDQRPF